MAASPSSGVNYAETQLEVHAVYEDCIAAQERLDKIHEGILSVKHSKTWAEESLKDAEAQFTIEQRAEFRELSQAAFDKQLKTSMRLDTNLKQLRQDIINYETNLATIEQQARSHESQIRILTARMNELSGYLVYLAALKNAQIQKDQKEKVW